MPPVVTVADWQVAMTVPAAADVAALDSWEAAASVRDLAVRFLVYRSLQPEAPLPSAAVGAGVSAACAGESAACAGVSVAVQPPSPWTAPYAATTRCTVHPAHRLSSRQAQRAQIAAAGWLAQ